jgi:hypothetical protein
MFIPGPGSEFYNPGSRIQGLKGPGSASNNLSIFKVLGNIIWDPGLKSTGSRIRICFLGNSFIIFLAQLHMFEVRKNTIL